MTKVVLLAGTVGSLLLAAGVAAAPPPVSEAAVGCGEMTTERVRGARVLLDSVVLPKPVELERPARTDSGRAALPYFRSARIAIRAGEPDVSIAIPHGWRHRVALSWGRVAGASSLTFDRCSGTRSGWSVYAGGFHLRTPGDCVPVVVRVGGTATTVRLGVGRACGAD
jgi:hypothetical protein